MKKFFKKAFVVLGIMGMGLGTASCGAEEIIGAIVENGGLTILQQLLGNIFNKGGQPNTYQGTYSLQHLVSDGKDGYTASSEKLTFDNTMCQATLGANNAVKITLPGTDGIGEAEMTQIDIYNLQFAKAENGNELTSVVELSDNSSIDGSLKIGDKTYAASNLYLKCNITESSFVISEASIYFGENEDQVINVTFNGTIYTPQEQNNNGQAQ